MATHYDSTPSFLTAELYSIAYVRLATVMTSDWARRRNARYFMEIMAF